MRSIPKCLAEAIDTCWVEHALHKVKLTSKDAIGWAADHAFSYIVFRTLQHYLHYFHSSQ